MRTVKNADLDFFIASLRGFERTLDGGNDFALRGQRRAGNPCARCRRMAAAAELAADFADVHRRVFGTQADARHLRLHFFKHAGDDDWLDGADVVNQTFRVIALRAGAVEIFLLEPEPRNFFIGRQAEFGIDVLQQFRAGDGIGLELRCKSARGSRRA